MIKIYKSNDSYMIAVDNEIPPFSLKGVFNFLKLHFHNVEILHKPPYKNAEGILFTPSAKIVFTSSVDIEDVEKLLRKRFTNTRIVSESSHCFSGNTFVVKTLKGVSYVQFLLYPHGVFFGKNVICTNGLFVVEKSNTDAANFFLKKLSK